MDNYNTDLSNYLNGYMNLNAPVINSDKKLPLDTMICPCCGKQLRLVDSSKNMFDGDDLYTVNEAMSLNENKLSDYLLSIIEEEARSIVEDEFDVETPETDDSGNIINDYGERFLYVSKELKKVIKMKANAISNMIKHQGIDVSPFYIENELFQTIKTYGNIGKR